MAAERVRFGVIGTGGMGTGHCNYLPDLPETTLTAICDNNPAVCKATAEKFGVPGFENHIELLESGLVDAVLIATPHYFHPPIAEDAFAKGIHVLSEKPLGVTVGTVDAMLRAAQTSGCKFGVMYQMRAEPQNQVARQIVESGALGEVYRTSLIMGWYRSQAYYDSGGWRATWSGEGGGVLINQAPHLLDMFTWLGGMPSRITAQTRTSLHDIEVEDVAFAVLDYANGAHGYLYTSTTEVPQKQSLEICGDRGKLEIVNGALKFYRVDGSIREFTRTTEVMWGAPGASDATPEIPPKAEIKDHAAITVNFARAILHGEPLIAPGEEGLNAVELINGIILSSKRAKPVSVPVDRSEYETLIEELKAASREKSNLREQRVTDPNFQ